MLEHGGRLRAAAQRYGIPLEDWLDLSTGVAPYGWDLPVVPGSAWARLPEADDGLEQAARDYYGAVSLLPVAGSQAAIQTLPRLRRNASVGIIAPTYAEHAAAWRREGHRVTKLSEGSVHRALPHLDVLLVVNPNNPTASAIISTVTLSSPCSRKSFSAVSRISCSRRRNSRWLPTATCRG
ncbi:hypothetical protein JF55_02120 [Pseudomonas sp. 1-7]|nr:hypothetical protein JF55_02120 [Pseudomonas sp. 1-7]